MKRLLVLAAAAGVVWGAVGMSGCSVNAATGRRQFNAMSRDEEIALGASEGPKFAVEFGGAVNNAALQSYVKSIGMALASKTEGENPSLPWEFTLLNTDVINAFALPGGKIFFTRGLAAQMSNEAQMAAVLGHEVGHVTARHINDAMVRSGLTSLVVQGAAAASGEKYGQAVGEVGQQVGGVILLKYGRSQESEADSLGMRYMVKLNYDPRGALQVMEILKAASGGAEPPEWLSTHPLPQTRIQDVTKIIATQYAATQNNPQYSLKEAEFRGFKSALMALPPAPKAKESSGDGAKGLRRGKSRAMIGTSVVGAEQWCLHCALERRAAGGG